MIGEKALKAILVFLAAYHVLQGLLALLAPGTFFEEIGLYGIENSHYVGDVGAFVLAYGVAIALAVTRPSWRAPLLWLGALLVRLPRAQPRLRHRRGEERRARLDGHAPDRLRRRGRGLAGAGLRTAQRRKRGGGA